MASTWKVQSRVATILVHGFAAAFAVRLQRPETGCMQTRSLRRDGVPSTAARKQVAREMLAMALEM